MSRDIIYKWEKQKYLTLDGYRSTSLDESVARRFAILGETDQLDMVLFKIELENKKGKYHFCLDREDYSLYPSENEVLLQAGI